MSNPSGNDVLMGSGESVPSFKFNNPGDSVQGRITAPPTPYQVREYDRNNPGAGPLKFYPSGDPIMALYVDIATDLRDPNLKDDDGVRRVYLEGRYVKADVAAAVRQAGAQGLEVGGVLTLAFTHREDPADKGSRKFWQAQYVPAGNAALMGADTAPQVAVPAPAQQAAAPAPAKQQTPPPATAPTAENPAVKAKGMSAVGMTPDQIAGAMGLDVGVVHYLLAS
ncbi:MAG: hypothetical protein J0H73_13680 [Salana multivorans]|uniref:hypothetical protein n=1 Tax=Salana multivorans TaxID=120377 RepID=UPI00095BE766|nr:hypothetical protein [Salana multivorans]MBN8883350.1 hypothetical protein [Salana multivorans]OJX98436.1 MAG: hypothetical protein BGO96_04550 [Micrococcales bacterium 73-15]